MTDEPDEYMRNRRDNMRDNYQRRVRELAAERAATPKPKRTLYEKVRDLVARTPVPAPKRISGPRLMPDNWSEPAGQATLPLAGPRCMNPDCRQSMLPGSGLLSERGGLCGACAKHGMAAPPLHAEPDGPPMEAA